MSGTKVQYVLTDGVAVVTLDDGKANAFNPALFAELNPILDQAEKEADALVLAGRPGRYSAGFDLATVGASNEAARTSMKLGGELLMRLYGFPKIVVAACTGHAVAFGALLLLAASHRVGARGDFKIGLNEVAIGLMLPQFGTRLAEARLSKRHLQRAVCLSTIYDPESAIDVGFLDELADPEQVISQASEIARGYTKLSGTAYVLTQANLRRQLVKDVLNSIEEDLKSVTVPNQ